MVFDPRLPAETLARLRAGEGALLLDRPGTRPGSYRFARQRLVAGAVVFGAAAAAVEGLQRTGGTGWAAAAGIAAAFGYVPVNASDRRATGLLGAGLTGCFLGLWGVWAIVLAEAFGTVTAPFGILHGFAFAIFIAGGARGVTHVLGRDRAIDPAGLGPAERARLADVRRARERVAEAGRLLAPAFDAAPVLTVLDEAEWAMACRMRERASRAGAGAPVTAAPGRAPAARCARAAGRDADARLIARIPTLLEAVDAAVRAHRAWERCTRTADAGRPAGPSPGFARHPDLTGDLGLEAVRRVRDDLAARAVRAGAAFADALREDCANGPSGG
ncbi:hypothetical protein [Actinomadura sediminis]|uniref:FUSC family protein n=1 Tax=Actinomadura sediminis TaxID=1038904 RepID=A0ABW3EW81_9ACTN